MKSEDELQALLGGLSPALKSAWAKSGVVDGNPFADWLPLVGHAMDAAAVAETLWDHWLAGSQRRVIGDCFSSEKEARTFVALAAAVHDIGKISKPFARQVGQFADLMADVGLRTAGNSTTEAQTNRWMRHELAGAIALQMAGEKLGWNKGAAVALATVAGGHHGIPTQTRQSNTARRERLHYLIDDEPDDPWADAQTEFAEFAVAMTEAAPAAPVDFNQGALVLLQAIVMVADWISSSTEYFPLTATSDRDFEYLRRGEGQSGRVKRGLEKLALPTRWEPVDLGVSASELLQKKLGLPFPARPLQEEAVKAARNIPGPGLIIIEDAMGSGKTEAAFVSSEILAERFGANGLLVALPTQATTDAMFKRMLDFLKIQSNEQTSPKATALLHGRSGWNPDLADLQIAGRAFLDRAAGTFEVDLGDGQIEVENVEEAADKPQVAVHPWLRGRHKAILSSFVATTVDHLLMGALQMKHLALRHLGLSSKVVIFDEVHASSRFMNFFAERVLEWLGAYQTPVIMLSATLDQELRDRLSAAYLKGLAASGGDEAQVEESGGFLGTELGPAEVAEAVESPYPRLTTVSAGDVEVTAVEPATPPRTVRVKATQPGETAASVTMEVAESGEGNILVLTNTVSRAQETYQELSEAYGDAVRLVHARFTAADRMANDGWLLDAYGPDSASRPSFSIVVATQVVEQSLDVDFDVLVTDVAPVDLILQRIGRVHRHAGRTRPRALCEPVCYLVGAPPLDAEPNLQEKGTALAGACRVYGAKPVLSGVLSLGPDLYAGPGRPIVLPEEIGSLVQAAASDAFDVPPEWEASLEKAQEDWDKEEREAEEAVAKTRLSSPGDYVGLFPTLDNWYGAAPAETDGPARVARGKVRDGLEGLAVVLLQKRGEDFYTMPNDRNPQGALLPTDVEPEGWLARQALLGTVALPWWSVMKTEEAIKDLEQRAWGPGWESSRLLSGELFLPLEQGEAELAGYRYRYSRESGLEVKHD